MAKGKKGTVSCRCGSTNLRRDATQPTGFRSRCYACQREDNRVWRERLKAGLVQPVIPQMTDDELPERLRVVLIARRQQPWTFEELSDHFNCGMGRVRTALLKLDDRGLNIREATGGGFFIGGEIPVATPTVIPLESLKGKPYKFGLTSDNHLASKYARLDVLNTIFDWYADQGITTVYQCGNMIDGEARFNKGDLLAYGIEGQTDYFIEHWPQRKGMTTYFVTGDDHEGWYVQREGVNIGKHLMDAAREAGRNDLVYLGHMEHDVILKAEAGEARMRLIHAGGGAAYALSYAPQQIINSYSGGEKPTILLVGHYHKAEFNYWREVLTVQAGATQDQTPFLRKKRIQSHLGGWTISFEQSKDGLVHAFTPCWLPLYNREFYEAEQWRYHWRKDARCHG